MIISKYQKINGHIALVERWYLYVEYRYGEFPGCGTCENMCNRNVIRMAESERSFLYLTMEEAIQRNRSLVKQWSSNPKSEEFWGLYSEE